MKNPTEVNVYDFIDKTNGKASPYGYGVYDIGNNSGWANVGISSDTASDFSPTPKAETVLNCRNRP